MVETVSGMSTEVDLTYKNKHVHVETVSEMSTKVDALKCMINNIS